MESRSIVFLLCLCSISGALAKTWIVSPTENCSRANCHNLSYYTGDPSLYFSTDTTLIFLEGVHYLYEPVTISGVSNLTLQGEGILQDGSHWTVRESTVVIHCLNSEAGLFFVNWTGITINSITFESCGAKIINESQLGSDINTHYSSVPYGWEFGVGLQAYHTLLFVNGSDLTLESVTVQNGTGYGLTIVNSYDITINRSYFYKNNYRYLCNESYDQAGGNIRITHLPLLSSSRCPRVKEIESVILIRDTRVSFGVNQRICDPYFMASSENLTTYARYTLPVGGGIGLVAADYSCNKFRYKLENIVAYKNYAYYSGSNFALIFYPVPISISGMLSTRGFTASDCPVQDPSSIMSKGSGMIFSVFDSLESGINSELNITGLVSSNNIALIGSGLYISTHTKRSWSSINIKSSNFTRNNVRYIGASAVYIERRDIAEISSSLIVSLTDVSINETVNSLPNYENPYNGALSLSNIDCVINGLVIANSANIRGLSLASSRVFVQGDNLIHNNTALFGSGGGVYMDPYSYFIFQPPANLTFSRNYADQYGGGIYISPRANRVFSPPCFFQIDSLLPLPEVRLIADGNTANITGTFISGGELVYCFFVTNFYYSYCRNSPQLSCSYNVMQNFIVPNTSTQDRFFISSVPVAVLLCNDSDNIILYVRNKAVSVMPGQSFALKLVVLSETYGIAPGKIHSSANGVTTTNSIKANCTEISFTYYKPIGVRNIHISLTTDQSVAYIHQSTTPLCVNLTYADCPPFFQLVSNSANSSICGCNRYISNATESAVCNINTTMITTTYNEVTNWIGYDNNSSCTFVGQCPFGYCKDEEVTFTVNDVDKQCALDRSGVLCGGCAEGFSIKLGSNECGQCSNGYLSLLLVFGIAGIVLVIFLILLNLTVTIGTINGLIFYANIAKIVEPILFQTDSILVLSQFISWINLDFGVKVCFYDGMTPSQKIWWQFAFPIYIWIIIGKFDPKASLKKIMEFRLSNDSNTSSASLIPNEGTADDTQVVDTGYVSADSQVPKVKRYSKYRNSALDLMDDFIN
uniref:Right handed beta helix domain-containing protein n=1 Tax=Amphimedon queenslandica TaxID=400682 RepID=A0A1X7VRB6_AMPQE